MSDVKPVRIDLERIIAALGEQGADDIRWAESIDLPDNAEDFALETIFVICNSGMKNTIARRIFEKIKLALSARQSASAVFGHAGKASAIDRIWLNRRSLFDALLATSDRLAFCETLPFIGKITKYHLAKNFGAQVAKPDVHLQRLADQHNTTPQALCEEIAKNTGYKVATVDTLLWRACASGVINSRTGEVRA